MVDDRLRPGIDGEASNWDHVGRGSVNRVNQITVGCHIVHVSKVGLLDGGRLGALAEGRFQTGPGGLKK